MPLPAISRDRILALTERARTARVVVLGDVMLDRYLEGDTDRLSPEAPVPVVTVSQGRATLGGAANVAANVVAIGAECRLLGVVGDDPNGMSVRTELATVGIHDAGVHTSPGRPTTTKTRVIARGQQIVRIDEEVETPLEGPAAARLGEAVQTALDDADALVLEDYNKGVLTPALIRQVMARARERGIPVVVDPKYRNFFEYAGATVFKPNRRELESALGAAHDLEHPEALTAALDRLGVDNLLMTIGSAGMVLASASGGGEVTHIPALVRPVYDVSGAGDTVTAWVGTMLAAGASMGEAARLANWAAAVEVGKAGVATVSPDEVLAVHEERHDQIGRLRRGGAL